MTRRHPEFESGKAGVEAAKLKKFSYADGSQRQWLSDAVRNQVLRLFGYMLLSDFQVIRPQFEMSQEDTLSWIADAHIQSEAKQKSPDELELFRKSIREKLWHVGCKPDRIEKRGHVLADFLHRDWKQMKIYSLDESPKGKDLSYRSQVYGETVDQIFERYYPDGSSPPDDLIHVSCTGYLSPSGAQKVVSRRGWGQNTVVTHSYHMGCYGAFPALRMAEGFLRKKKQIDVVHTEICCLHMNPASHSTDQLVTQSLFADGFIKYSIRKKGKFPHLKVLALAEEMIPESTHSMSWNVVDWGNQMYLGKEVPVLIARHVQGYLNRLPISSPTPLFAIHPGGPKILLQLQELLHLKDEQLKASFEVLKKYGNMSSATIPHIWQEILQDPKIPSQTQIVSLAFGPGLTISGSLMEKRCGS